MREFFVTIQASEGILTLHEKEKVKFKLLLKPFYEQFKSDRAGGRWRFVICRLSESLLEGE